MVSLRCQAEIHHDGGVDFDGLSVKECGALAPLADGLDGGAREVRIDLAVHNAEGERLSVHANHGVEDDRAADAGRLGGIGIDRLDFRHDFGGLDIAADAEAG